MGYSVAVVWNSDRAKGLALFSLWQEDSVKKLFRKEFVMNDYKNESIGGGGIEVPIGLESDVGDLKYAELQTLCKQQGVSAYGKKDELVKRLTIAKEGHTEKHVHGRTKCKICGAKTGVTGTSREKMPDGRILVIRKMRCAGKHRCTYPLKSIEGTAK